MIAVYQFEFGVKTRLVCYTFGFCLWSFFSVIVIDKTGITFPRSRDFYSFIESKYTHTKRIQHKIPLLFDFLFKYTNFVRDHKNCVKPE